MHRLSLVALTLLACLSSSSRTPLQAADDLPTVYSPVYERAVVFTVPLLSDVAFSDNGVDPYGGPSVTATATLQDVTALAEGQYGHFLVDCVPGVPCSAGSPNRDIRGSIFNITPTPTVLFPKAGTVRLGWLDVSGFPATVPGESFGSRLLFPRGGATDGAGNLYVADTGNHRVVVFAPNGSLVRTIGRYGTPLALDVTDDSPSNADWPTAFCPDVWYNGTAATRVNCTSNPADNLGQFFNPVDVAVSTDGSTIIVTDAYNYRLQILTRNPDGEDLAASDGDLYDVEAMGTFAVDGPVGTFSAPWGLALSPTGRIAVSESDNDRVQLFDPDGTIDCNDPDSNAVCGSRGSAFRATTFGVHGDTSLGQTPVQWEMDSPFDVAIDPASGRIIVADTDNNRIQIIDASNVANIKTFAILGRPDGLPGSGIPNDGLFPPGLPDYDGPEFRAPWGVTTDAAGRLFVTELYGNRVQVFDPTLTGYAWVASFGSGEATQVLLNGPVGIAVGPSTATVADAHSLFVVDLAGHRIQRLAAPRLAVTSVTTDRLSLPADEFALVRVRVKNTGPLALTSVTPQLSWNAPYSVTATLVPAAPGDPMCGPVSCTLGADEEHEFTFEVRSATVTTGAPLALTATATGLAGTVFLTATGNAPHITVTEEGAAAIAATLVAPEQATINVPFEVQVTLDNSGNTDLTNVSVHLEALGGGATVTAPADQVVGALNRGTSATRAFTVTGSAEGIASLTATVTSDQTAVVTSLADVSIETDLEGPSVQTAVVSGTLANNGWYKCGDGATPCVVNDLVDPVLVNELPVVRITASDPSGVDRIWFWSDSQAIAQSPVWVPGSGQQTAHHDIRIPREGEVLIAYWATDAIGNTETATGGGRQIGESLAGFCQRTSQCLKIGVDNLKPTLVSDSLTINPLAGTVTVHFSSTDDHSSVLRVTLAGTEHQAQLIMDPPPVGSPPGTPASNSRGTLILTSTNGENVFGTVTVEDRAGWTRDFSLPYASDYKPTAVGETYFTHTALTVPAANGVIQNALGRDTDPLNAPLTVKLPLIREPRNGVVSVNANGSFTYTPRLNPDGTLFFGTDDFVYVVINSSGAESAPAQTNINITNLVPRAVADAYTVFKRELVLNVPASDGVLSSHGIPGGADSDPDAGDTLTAVLVRQPFNGTVSAFTADGSFTYTPTPGFAGVDTFEYRALDGYSNSLTGQSNKRTVTITVIDEPPDTNPDAYTTHKTLTVNTANGVRTNDTDPDDATGTLTTQVVTPPSHGIVALNADGSFVYTQTPGYVGFDTFTYRALDPSYLVPAPSDGISDAETVTIEITNIPPTAVNDAYTTHKTLTVAGPGILANDSDGDTPQDPLTAVQFSSTTNGTLIPQANGSFVYTPAPGFTGIDSFTYRAHDGYVMSNLATVTITVTNDAPVAVNDAYTVPKNVLSTITAANGVIQHVPGTDTDPNGDTLAASVVATTMPLSTLVLAANGSFLYTPKPGFVGTDTFTYRVNDGYLGGDSNIATVTLTIANQPPVANDDAYTTAGLLTIAPLGVKVNDTDADDLVATLLVSLVDNVDHGILTLLPTGAFTYLPALGFHGTDTFTYRLSDGSDSDTAVATITVGNVAPVAVDDAYVTQKNTVLTVLLGSGVRVNDTDDDDAVASLVVGLVAGPAHGTLTLNGNGSFTYTPEPGYAGTDTFTYRVSDGQATSNVATVTLTIANRRPVAANDSYTTAKNTVLTVNAANGVILNATGLDTDPDGDALTATLVTPTTNGTLTLNPNGAFTYAPNSGFSGTDTFTYTVNDGALDSNVATATITVTNTAPVAVNDSYTTPKNTALNIAAANGVILNASGHDTDANGDSLTAALVGTTAHGTLALAADGAFIYAPNAGFVGVDTFTYRVNDGDADSNVATVSITVTNQAPVAVNDDYTTHGTLLIGEPGGVRSNDTDPDNPQSALSVTSLIGPAHGTLTLNPDGSFTYTPAAGYSGTDTFTYSVSDGIATDTATVSITITNAPPVAVNDAYTGARNTTLTVAQANGVILNAAGLDTDADNDPLTAVLVSPASHGTVTLAATGAFVYAPAAGYVGTDTFTYKVNDGRADSNVATVVITIPNTNQLPVAVNDIYSTHGTLTVPPAQGVRLNDSDPDDPTTSLTVLLESGPSSGTLTLNSDGSFTYVPQAGFVGSVTFTYKLSDGTATSSIATVTITVTNQVPVAVNNAYATGRNTVLNVAPAGVLSNDTDADGDALTAVNLTNPLHGTVTMSSNGAFVYTPATGYIGTDSFTYKANDGRADSPAATVTITIVNLTPSAVDDAYVTTKNQALIVPTPGVLLNDSDPDDLRATLTAWIVTPPTSGTVTLNPSGAFTYMPASGFVGTATFTYRTKDPAGNYSSPATVTITVRNQTPVCSVAAPSSATLWPPNHKKVDPITIRNVTDPDGDALAIKITYIWQDEPTDSTGDGAFNIDGWGVGTSTATVRRERQGTRSTPPGDGRVYEIGFEATDGIATCTGKVFVGIPHDQGNFTHPGSRIAVDSVWRWNSTVANGPSLNGGPNYKVQPGGGGGNDDGDKKK